MATATPEMNFCSNCERNIATSNFLMHEVYCKRNIVLCQQCQEPVSRSELDAHIKEEHTPELCNLCGASIEKQIIAEHKDKLCPKRIVPCSICEMDCKFVDLGPHEEYCGSRTEQCLKCSQYIMKKDSVQHEASACSFPLNNSTKKPVQNLRPLNTFAVDKFSRTVQNHVQRDRGIPKVNNVKRKEVNRGKNHASANSDMDAILAAHLAQELNSAVSLNPSSPVHNLRDSALENFGNHLHDEQRRQQGDVVPCEYCDEHFPISSIQLHQGICCHNLVAQNSTQGLPSVPVAIPAMHGDYVMDEEVMIPCEFCSVLLPYDSLIMHQATCVEDVASSASAPSSVKPKDNRTNDQTSSGASRHQREPLDEADTSAPRNNTVPKRQNNSPRRPYRHSNRGGSRAPSEVNAFRPEEGDSSRGRGRHNKNTQRGSRGGAARGSRPPRSECHQMNAQPHKGRGHTSPKHQDWGVQDFRTTRGNRGRRGRGLHQENNQTDHNADVDLGFSQLHGTLNSPSNNWHHSGEATTGFNPAAGGRNLSPRGGGTRRLNNPRGRQPRGNRRPNSRSFRGPSNSSSNVPCFASPSYDDDEQCNERP